MPKLIAVFVLIGWLVASCGTNKKLAKNPATDILVDTALTNANIGIAVFNVSTNKYVIKHNSDKYFIPASNTKLLTCYAALKYLGPNLEGLRYEFEKDTLHIQGTGDPSFLIDEFKTQPVANFFYNNKNKNIVWHINNWKENKWGFGWSWTDFGENYCQERSVLPMFYNTAKFSLTRAGMQTTPSYFNYLLKGYAPESNQFTIVKNIDDNIFNYNNSNEPFKSKSFSYTTNTTTVAALLQREFSNSLLVNDKSDKKLSQVVLSQPTDSVLKPMMHRSDNFFAEQLLLMCSQKQLGYMNNSAFIEYLKKNDFAGIPQMPRWVDGSGLSRYNMFTPESLVWLLQKMKTEFGIDRLREILPTGGEGTLSSLYKNITGNVFAKTGTLSNHAALSGYLYTKKGTLLIFSTLTSGYQGSANPTRKAVEKFVSDLYEQY